MQIYAKKLLCETLIIRGVTRISIIGWNILGGRPRVGPEPSTSNAREFSKIFERMVQKLHKLAYFTKNLNLIFRAFGRKAQIVRTFLTKVQ